MFKVAIFNIVLLEINFPEGVEQRHCEDFVSLRLFFIFSGRQILFGHQPTSYELDGMLLTRDRESQGLTARVLGARFLMSFLNSTRSLRSSRSMIICDVIRKYLWTRTLAAVPYISHRIYMQRGDTCREMCAYMHMHGTREIKIDRTDR